MTPKQAGNAMHHARRLLRQGEIDREAFAVFDYLMFGCGRKPFADQVERSYTAIMAGVHCCKELAVRCVALLVRVGLIAKERRRLTIPWHNGGTQNVQLANRYRILACDCESAERPRDEEVSKKKEKRGIEQAIRAIWNRRRRPRLPERTPEEQKAALLL